jgi:predicted restriction endonuclease
MVRRKERGYRQPKNATEARERMAASIAGRRGQRAFRQQLLRTYKQCLVTGCDAEAVLEAAHIQAYREEGTFDASNGLLLRADIHTLFDLGFIAIHTADMTVIIAEALKNTVYGALDGRPLHLPRGTEHVPDREALDTHRIQSALQRQQKAFVL